MQAIRCINGLPCQVPFVNSKQPQRFARLTASSARDFSDYESLDRARGVIKSLVENNQGLFKKIRKEGQMWGLDNFLDKAQIENPELFKQIQQLRQEGSGKQSEEMAEGAAHQEPHAVAADIEETKDGYHLFIDAPGIEKSSAQISLKPGSRVMIVSWRRERMSTQMAYKGKYERQMGEFRRVVTLARDCDPSTIKAQLKNGVLHISAKKRLPERTIEITN